MARLRSAATPQNAPPAETKRAALKEKTNTTRTKAPVYEDDGNAEGLVKSAEKQRGRPRKAATQNEDDLVMAGGLGPTEAQELDSNPDEAPLTTDELAKSDAQTLPVTTDELAKSDSVSTVPTAKASTGRRPPRMTRKPARNEAQNKVFGDMKRRMQATARSEVASSAAKKDPVPMTSETAVPSSEDLPQKPSGAPQPARRASEHSELSLSQSPESPKDSAALRGKRTSTVNPGSALKSQSTPAVESSMLALKNFKRRPRQPSMLAMVQQRTAGARQSTVTVQANEDLSGFDLDAGTDEEEDFAPEAEGTPLHVARTKRPTPSSAKPARSSASKTAANVGASSSRKRKSGDVSSSALDALKAKRRKSEAPAVEEATKGSAPVQVDATPEPPAADDVQVINSSPLESPSESPPPRELHSKEPEIAVPSTDPERYDELQVPASEDEASEENLVSNGIMAEPASSSPTRGEPAPTQSTDIMADPLTQVSPPRRQSVEKAKKKSKPVTTSALQSFLPKRRTRPLPRSRKTEYDIDSASEDDDDNAPLDTSHLDDEEDELSGVLQRPQKRASKNRKPAAKPKSRPTKASRKRPAPRKPESRKTYARASAATTNSDKENEADDTITLPDASLTLTQASRSAELEAARLKFAEVDGWDLEFESLSGEEGRSSSQAWR